MNALITGGAGFIGSHLADRCLAEGWRVAILDDLSSGAVANFEHLKTRAVFTYKIGSVFNEPLVAEMVDAADVVFHLAAAVGVKRIVKSPVRTIETNVHGTEVVLRCAAKKAGLSLSLRLRKSMARAIVCLSANKTTLSSGRPVSAAGVTPSRKLWMNR